MVHFKTPAQFSSLLCILTTNLRGVYKNGDLIIMGSKWPLLDWIRNKSSGFAHGQSVLSCPSCWVTQHKVQSGREKC